MRSNRTIMGEGEWYEIFNFKLRFNFRQFRTTKNRFHVITGENTVVRKVTTTAPCNYYGFKEFKTILRGFKTILRGLAHPMYSVGRLTWIKNIEGCSKIEFEPNIPQIQSLRQL
ncbi:hypothetical protein Bca4012_003992 [Brassica carinata]|uniref:(rape) hypothetical protein n=1 Tax=Brassica napus TaxID=3708 RepID=A0A816IA91_BRANA|nr:unnamed protein product [Brassica napus]